ncbi:MAG: serine/threonine protein phosphatase [Kofleriaceae bacterium]|nr:serine/threonine protein phosphatase [Kofleriaceae bacterium]MCL4228586.1 metallophosphoesterase [Myxococcales bacterium]
MIAGGRTFVIGDVHGERALLEALLAALPFIAPDDTLVLLGDYVDRGPDSQGVIALLRRLPEQTAGKVVLLRGNHEDALLEAVDGDGAGFLLPPSNGVAACFHSFTELPPPPAGEGMVAAEHFARYLEPRLWLPAPVVRWMDALPLWYRDAHATYVHAGLEGEGSEWFLPERSSAKSLLWQREPDFFTGYGGPPLVFGHTPTSDLPPADPTRTRPWHRGTLFGLDTGAGKGGPLTCLELPDHTVRQAFPDGRVETSTLA